ncbi:MAG: methyltransferase domain-containing protein [Streptosporangiales bacterium]
MRLAIEVAGTPAQAFDRVVDELPSGLDRLAPSRLRFEPGDDGRLVDGEAVVADIRVWRPGERLVLAWRREPWQPEADTETDFTFEETADGTRVSVQHRRWDAVVAASMGVEEEIGGWQEALGWFTGQVVAPFVAAASPRRLADWLTDRIARRPTGLLARAVYADPIEHQSGWEHVLTALQLGPDDRLLEIGCGGGGLLDWALRTGCRATGVDHSRDMLSLAAQRNADAVAQAQLVLLQADAADLPVSDGAFTAVAMATVFMHLPDPAAVLAECRRVLDGSGRLAVATVDASMRGTPAAPEPIASRSGFYDRDRLIAMARDADFATAEVADDGGEQLLFARVQA